MPQTAIETTGNISPLQHEKEAEQVLAKVFGDPEKLDRAAKKTWDLLQSKEQYGNQKAVIKAMLAETAGRVIDTMAQYEKDKSKVVAKTREALASLDALVTTTGRTFKTINTPYSQDPEHDIMDEDEFRMFKEFVGSMERLHPNDLIDILLE